MDKCYGLMINEKKQKSNRNRTQVFSKKSFRKTLSETEKKNRKQQEMTEKMQKMNGQAFTSGTPRSAALLTISSETLLSVTIRKTLEMGQITEK